MQEFRIGQATVRIHGRPDEEKLRAATEKYLKKMVQAKKKEKRESA